MNKNNLNMTSVCSSALSGVASLKKLTLSLAGAAVLCAGQAQAGVAQAQVKALARDGVKCLRGITDPEFTLSDSRLS